MNKFLLIPLFFLSAVALGQTNIGLKVAPLIASNRVSNDELTAQGDGTAFKFSVGVVIDKPLSDNYSFSSGLVYVPKYVAFNDSLTEAYKAQYLQIPVTLKLFTNEVAPDIKIYFQIGSGLEFNVFEEKEDRAYEVIQNIKPIDVSVLLGGGVEYRAGINTTLYAGVTYQRGLTNVVGKVNDPAFDDLKIRNTIISFDLGVKFN